MAERGRAGADSTLTGAVIAFLRRHPPFDEAEEDALRFLASRLSVGYFAAATRILAPEHGEPAHLFIVQSGTVRVEPADTYHLPPARDGTLGPGECFSVGALLEHRPVGAPYVAATDVFCYLLPAADFQPLLDRSPRLRAFATRYLGSLLRESRRLLAMHHAGVAAEARTQARALRAVIARAPVACRPDTPIGEALRVMNAERIGSILVTTPDGAPAGIFTRHDVLDRVALAGRRLDEPIGSVMTPAPRTLPAEASVYDAALLIATRGFRHVPVVDGGRVIGVVTERDLFALQRLGIRSAHRAIADAKTIEALQAAARDVRALWRTLVAEGTAAEPLMLIVSALTDALTRRVIEIESARHAIEGAAWSWLAFGAEGRHEQTPGSDQDNGIVFDVPPGGDAEAVRGRLLPFARAVNRALEACGIPPCDGGIMAGNPECCLSLEEWGRRFAQWIEVSEPQALLRSAIFFDLRAVHGRAELAETLRAGLLARAGATPRFLRHLAEHALAVRAPLGVFGDIAVGGGEDGGTVDIKASGTRLFADAARVMALATGVAHTGTAERLRQAGAKLGVDRAETEAWTEAFFFLQMLRLRRQSGQLEAGRGPGNRIDPARLNEVDRRTLKEALRQARKLQLRLALDYHL